MATAHENLVNEILIELSRHQHIRVWKLVQGFGTAPSGRAMHFGSLPGAADINGIIGPSGKRLEIEVKTANDTQSKEQKNYQRVVESLGGVYILAYSLYEVTLELGKRGIVCDK